MPLEPNTCDNCGAPVLIRRPSKSGKHFCKASKCQTAKQRHYRESARGDSDTLVRQLLHDVVHGRRKECEICGLENALPGWAHRHAELRDQPCFGTGSLGPGLPSGMLDTVWPELVPTA